MPNGHHGSLQRRDRYVLAWRLSNPDRSGDADFCGETLEETLNKGRQEVFNTDQGRQFTSEAFTELLEHREVRISMDGKGRHLDNIFASLSGLPVILLALVLMRYRRLH